MQAKTLIKTLKTYTQQMKPQQEQLKQDKNK